MEFAGGEKFDTMFAGRASVGPASVGLPSVGLPSVGLDFSRATGHAIEVRVYAENPDEGFLPSPGRITHLRAPSGPGIRDDSGAFEGWTVPTAYDPLISKVVAWAPDRPGAIARMVRALYEYDVRGIRTTIGFCRDLVASPAFAAAEFDTTYVDRLLDENGSKGARSDASEEIAAIAAAMWEMERVRLKPDTTETPAPPVDAKTGSGAIFDNRPRKLHPTPFSIWAQRARLEALR